MRNWSPWFYENSKVPVWLSYLSPLNINAITLFCLVYARGTLSERTKRHETIHYQQYLETLVLGFLVLYLGEFLVRWVWYKFDGKKAYRMISFEQEAHEKDDLVDYMSKRTRWSWFPYLFKW